MRERGEREIDLSMRGYSYKSTISEVTHDDRHTCALSESESEKDERDNKKMMSVKGSTTEMHTGVAI